MKYIGSNPALRGRMAIVRSPIVTKGEPEGMVMVQFDYLPEWVAENQSNPPDTAGFKADSYGCLCHGWHPFDPEDFDDEVDTCPSG